MSSATEAVTNAAFAGIANANGAPRRTSQPVRSASAQRMLMPAATGAASEIGRVVMKLLRKILPVCSSVRDGAS